MQISICYTLYTDTLYTICDALYTMHYALCTMHYILCTKYFTNTSGILMCCIVYTVDHVLHAIYCTLTLYTT